MIFLNWDDNQPKVDLQNDFVVSSKENIALVEKSRIGIANKLNISPSRLFFFPNSDIAKYFSTLYISSKIKAIITCPFNKILYQKLLNNIARQLNIPVLTVNYSNDSSFDLSSFRRQIKQYSPAFVLLNSVNIRTGRFLPLKRIAQTCREYNSLFLCDFSVSLGKVPIDLANIPIDFFISESVAIGSKYSSALLYIDRRVDLSLFSVQLEMLIQQSNRDTMAIYCFDRIWDLWIRNQTQYNNFFEDLRKHLIDKLTESNLHFETFDYSEGFLSNFVNIYFPQIKNTDKFWLELQMNDVFVANGSLGNEKNRLLCAFSNKNTYQEIDTFVAILKNIIPRCC